jgi:hypothetical protein
MHHKTTIELLGHSLFATRHKKYLQKNKNSFLQLIKETYKIKLIAIYCYFKCLNKYMKYLKLENIQNLGFNKK